MIETWVCHVTDSLGTIASFSSLHNLLSYHVGLCTIFTLQCIRKVVFSTIKLLLF